MSGLLKLTTMLSVRQSSDLDLITDDLSRDLTRSPGVRGGRMTSVVAADLSWTTLSGVVLATTSIYRYSRSLW